MISRRSLLQGAAGLLIMREALAQGRVEKGIYRVRGDVRVNGEPAREGGEVHVADAIATGSDGEIVFVSGRDAMLARRNSSLSLLADGLRVVTGAVLSVFASGERKQIQTGTAVIGVRGTAVYVEAEASRTYVCTCYGEAMLEPLGDPASRETVRTAHHEQPRYVMASGAPQMIMRAPVVNHSDAELILLEGIVGRQPPFVGMGYRPY
jgi:hypothetical protein